MPRAGYPRGGIGQERVALLGEVDSDLVGTPGVEGHLGERRSANASRTRQSVTARRLLSPRR